ncbi:MAG: OmpA family protein [Bacteroidales bacterium]
MTKLIIRHSILLLILLMPLVMHGQDQRTLKKLFRDAEYFYLMEEYDRAISYYEQILKIDPDNSNVNYLIGTSYLNALDNRKMAIDYLKKAVKNVSRNYREGSYKERNAPPLAHFYLGRAYHINNQFHEAIETYKKYQENLVFVQFAEIEYVKRHIKSCDLARQMIRNPTDAIFTSLDHITGQKFPVKSPVVSGDGSTLIFSIEKPKGNSIAIVNRTKNSWSKPMIIDGDLDLSGNFFPVSLSFDGTELYIVYQDYMISDLFMSKYDGRRWSRAEPLGNNINSKYQETHASISSDGKTLYFTSDRKGSWGGLDIYRSVKDGSGKWTDPENLGFGINSYYNEETPFIAQNDSVLYFSSEGFNSMGGYDIYRTRIDEDGFFTVPQNLGYPVSTTDDDLFYNPGWDGKQGFYARQDETNPSNSIIYAVTGSEKREDEQLAASEIVSDSRTGSGEMAEDFYYIMNNILFDYNEYKLNDDAIREVERIHAMMKRHPEIEIELTGRTDSRGSAAYNRQLSRRRAESVKQYLVQRGIPSRKITVLAVGAEDPVAINRYEDGTDAPAGRLLNRNVSIRINDMDSHQVRMAEIFVPDRLIPEQDRVYTVLLLESKHLLDTIPDMIHGQPVSLVFTDESKMYTLGNFSNRNDAMEYLNDVLDNGYPDAYVMEKRNFESTIRERTFGDQAEILHYTIQLMALKKPIDPSYFSELGNVRQFVGTDGFHRYVYGIFASINESTEVLQLIKKKGYQNAFIKPLNHYESMSVK